ncbi:hypothetical protein HAX54_010336 [Datura stramonium]|uniref:Uncharacterized protein n=1 Tax=Datura stramonium TaxID=4076 RepID=A0ABS8THH8_DATST|nr:hypothetical protein [Datura stramonium]
MRLSELSIFHRKGGCLSLHSADDFTITLRIPTTLLSILNRGSILLTACLDCCYIFFQMVSMAFNSFFFLHFFNASVALKSPVELVEAALVSTIGGFKEAMMIFDNFIPF